jgi:hypothetical protein
MIIFIAYVVAVFALLSPAIIAGKFLDWCASKPQQERIKDAVGDVYLGASYGTLFQDYCGFLGKLLDRHFLAVYSFILISTFLCALGISFFLFGDVRLNSFLFWRYGLLSLVLALLGVADFYVTKKLVFLAAAGWKKTFFVASIVSIYVLISISSAFLATFFMPLVDLDFEFYVSFFSDRLFLFLQNPLGSGMSISSSLGNSVNASVFAYPAVVISTSTLVAGAAILFLSSSRLMVLRDFLADRVLSKNEKHIIQKLALAGCTILSVLIGAFLSLVN